MNATHFFRGKRITLMGLGLLGRAVGDAQYLAECGADLIVTDLKSSEELAESVTRLSSYKNIQFVLGEHRVEDFRDRDLIIKAAGVPLNSTYIKEAKKHNIPVRMSADLFMELSGVPAIGVTGTRGKSTVTYLISAILREAKIPMVLGGNVCEVSTLALLSEVTPEHIAVLELDSWQCQGLGEAGISPHIAVFTTFYPDHLNYYKDDLEQYLADKSNIFLHQSPDDTLVIGSQCATVLIDTYGEHIVSNVVIADETMLPTDWTLAIPGTHNRYNAGIALAIARAYGIADNISRPALEQFAGVPGRLELVTEKGGIRYYNDTASTTPEATLVALATLEPKHTVLIMGGADKGLDMSTLLSILPRVKKVVALAGTGTARIMEQLPEGTEVHDNFMEAIAAARSAAAPGDAVLLSPALASFGMFKNEYDRGDQFVELVHSHTK